MNWTLLMISLSFGGLFSYIYFKGLWLTVTRINKVPNPSLLIMLSFVLRTVFLMGCLVILFWYTNYYALASIVSFVAIRQLMIVKYQKDDVNSSPSRKDHHVNKS